MVTNSVTAHIPFYPYCSSVAVFPEHVSPQAPSFQVSIMARHTLLKHIKRAWRLLSFSWYPSVYYPNINLPSTQVHQIAIHYQVLRRFVSLIFITCVGMCRLHFFFLLLMPSKEPKVQKGGASTSHPTLAPKSCHSFSLSFTFRHRTCLYCITALLHSLLLQLLYSLILSLIPLHAALP
ncbi:hypothetical protein BC939DRAFT_263363 [Gamsiella multidivaricata]|uniref:uncharacterized protein n=1 Tax=Gamsiella multidivaricata TaxID=101098 RepID=UPI00221F1D28|nr:uncharacterized protein BC939DRAFT_263363 [Gamsiella multidivaricata]KAI7819383.1 hypothetical protein BC939DRAFT_263363 [Gamsiella multidivaricata]